MLPNLHPIYGPPGTGKTTTLVNLVRDRLREGTLLPQEVAYVAFTNKAANEATQRLTDQLTTPRSWLSHFSTIHAMANRAYKAQFGSSVSIMKARDFEAVGEACSLEVRGGWTIKDSEMMSTTGMGYGMGDFALNIINLAHARCIPLNRFLTKMDPLVLEIGKITQHDVAKFDEAMRAYKQKEGKIDFSDMLDRALTAAPLPVKLAIIDESQDLSAAQWKVCAHLLKNVEQTIIAGDDDQAIYQFSGADSKTFLNMGTLPTARVLEHSYRLPKPVYDFANRIISTVSNRVPKQWTPSDHAGSVRSESFDFLDYSKGEWLFLCRNRAHMRDFETQFRQQGFAYRHDNSSSVTPSYVRAIETWQHLIKGEAITVKQAEELYDKVEIHNGLMWGHRSTIGRKLKATGRQEFVLEDLRQNGLTLTKETPWFDALSGIPESSRMYLRALAARGELKTEPRLKVTTIHAIKGGEADNVVILPDMGRLTWDNYERNPVEEARVAYVAATRAKKNLFLLISDNEKQFPYFRYK
jgi:superfamily I DNA/RNA helicase